MTNDIRLTLRLPEDLHGQIAELTKENKTSLNGQIVSMLRDWFEQDPATLAARIAALEAQVAALRSAR